jgi:nucleotide-binding universal stress UspA family protein
LFRKILVPVDLAHKDQLKKALQAAADLSKHYDAPVVYVGVTTETPSSVAHTPAEFAEKLEAFGKAEAETHGHKVETKAVASPDPAIDTNDTLMELIEETGADLVVMASHVPNVTDYVWPSHGGTIASHSDASVFVVR